MADIGIGIKGRDVTFTLGGDAIVGVTSKSFTFNNELLDTTDDDSSGWQERLAEAGLKSIGFTVTGTLKNLELEKAFFATSQIFTVVVTYPEGSTLTFKAALASYSSEGESNGLFTYTAEFESSGVPVFVAGV